MVLTPICVPASIIGTPFYLMEYCPGIIYKDPSLPGLEPSRRQAIYSAMNQVLCRIHSVDLQAVGLDSFGKQGVQGQPILHQQFLSQSEALLLGSGCLGVPLHSPAQATPRLIITGSDYRPPIPG